MPRVHATMGQTAAWYWRIIIQQIDAATDCRATWWNRLALPGGAAGLGGGAGDGEWSG